MSAAFGAGDMTSANNAGGGGGGSASNVAGVLGNTISLDEIMRATKTNVRKKEKKGNWEGKGEGEEAGAAMFSSVSCLV